MPTNARRALSQDASSSSLSSYQYHFSSQKANQRRPPMTVTTPVAGRRGMVVKEEHREPRQSTTIGRYSTSRDVCIVDSSHNQMASTRKKWSCDVCERVFDDYQIATRHEEACKLKERLQRLDDRRSQQRNSASNSEKSSPETSHDTTTTVTNAYTNTLHIINRDVATPPMNRRSPSPVPPREIPTARKEVPIAVPRTIHVHNTFKRPLDNTPSFSIDPNHSSSFGTGTHNSYSTAQFQPQGLGAGNMVCYSTGAALPPSNNNNGGQQRRKSRPVYTMYVPPPTPPTPYDNTMKSPAVAYDFRDDIVPSGVVYTGPPESQQGRSQPGQEDARDDNPSSHDRHSCLHRSICQQYTTTTIPAARDVRVIHNRSNNTSQYPMRSRNENDEETEYDDDGAHPGKSMKWLCDVCKEAQFDNYVDAFRHEMNCRKQFFVQQQKQQQLLSTERESSIMANSEPDQRRTERRERLRQRWHDYSRSMYSNIESSIPGGGGGASAPVMESIPEESVGGNQNNRGTTGTKKWLCSICKQQYFEHYLDACRHEKQCMQMLQQSQLHEQQPQQSQLHGQQTHQAHQHYQPKSILRRPTLRDRRESYA